MKSNNLKMKSNNNNNNSVKTFYIYRISLSFSVKTTMRSIERFCLWLLVAYYAGLYLILWMP